MLNRGVWGKIAAAALIAASAAYYGAGQIGAAEIIPIKNGVKVFESADQRQIYQKLIIVRAPSDPYALKQTIERYDRENPLEDGDILNPEEIGSRQTDSKRTLYLREFYRQSRNTPRDWNGEPDADKDARAAAHMQDRIALILWEAGNRDKDYYCYDLDGDDASADRGVFFYRDGSVEDSRNAAEQSEWVVEKRGDERWIRRSQ